MSKSDFLHVLAACVNLTGERRGAAAKAKHRTAAAKFGEDEHDVPERLGYRIRKESRQIKNYKWVCVFNN